VTDVTVVAVGKASENASARSAGLKCPFVPPEGRLPLHEGHDGVQPERRRQQQDVGARRTQWQERNHGRSKRLLSDSVYAARTGVNLLVAFSMSWLSV
jgi:hypothetical protein